MTAFLNLAASLLFLMGAAAFLLQARLLGDQGTAFPTASFRRLVTLDLTAAVLALAGAPALLGVAVLPSWTILLALGGFSAGVVLAIKLLRTRCSR